MPNAKNIQSVTDLSTQLDSSSAVYLADYAGLTGSEQVELRSLVTQAGGELKITKNRLLAIALKNKHNEIGVDMQSALKGPNITLFAHDDAVAPLKALVEFAKKNERNQPSVKAGLLEGKSLSLNEVQHLASLPSKAELIGKLLGSLSAPARNIVGVLTAPTRNLVYALNAISKKQN